MELDHFIDEQTVRRVELGMLEDTLKKKWLMAEDFSLATQRNKEIDLLMHEMEEVAWRSASVIGESDKQAIEDMFFVDRGLDHFDNQFLDIDRESFSAFFDQANSFDSR